jgi:hypothetical protein
MVRDHHQTIQDPQKPSSEKKIMKKVAFFEIFLQKGECSLAFAPVAVIPSQRAF